MKVYAELPSKEMSKGIARVRDAIKRHAPKEVEFVGARAEADLIVHHVVGVQNYDSMPLHELIAFDNKSYAIIQYCWHTTENGGDHHYWEPLWAKAKCVWSYYDLVGAGRSYAPFYYAPLGVDDTFIHNPRIPKLFTIGTSGYVPETEGVRECARAAARVRNGFHFHLGPDFGLGPKSTSGTGLSDAQVAERWNECQYVAGLRRVEGFELPAAEGLICGARPIMFDAPHYRAWFGDMALYIPEGDENVVFAALLGLFQRPYEPVTAAERALARDRFNWQTLVSDFWRRVL